MNKNAIQKYAIWARNELRNQITQKAFQYGITPDEKPQKGLDSVNGIVLSPVEKKQRDQLVEQVNQKGFNQVIEELAYTWFNRLIAIRFMEVNDYLPDHIRVLSSPNNEFKPEILTTAVNLDDKHFNKDLILKLIDEGKQEELYRYLLIAECNALNEILPRMFETMDGYTELILPTNLLKPDSVIGKLISDIPEEDWKDQVQIIGWLYQYYNSELKDETFALSKKGKISKERIPSATQLFTPDWIVRYMVENSVGRIYIDKQKNEELYVDGMDEQSIEEARPDIEKEIANKMGWKYFVPEPIQELDVRKKLQGIQRESFNQGPEEIKVFDPCMGSGHVLVYAFDILVQIYKEYGFTERDAAQSILKYNIYGLDIDDRAGQLAYFSVMMKARQYDRRIFTRQIIPNVISIAESDTVTKDVIDSFSNKNPKLRSSLQTIIKSLANAKEYGSLLEIPPIAYGEISRRIEEIENNNNLDKEIILNSLTPLIETAKILSGSYSAVITNPPYLSISKVDPILGNFVKENFPDSKSDLYSAFIERCKKMTIKDGYQAMITQHSWMFISSYEVLRKKIFHLDTVNMIHLGPRAFEEIAGEVVQTTSFVLRNQYHPNYVGAYARLIGANSQGEKEKLFLSGQDFHIAKQSDFSKIPGEPVAYWANGAIIDAFSNGTPLGNLAITRNGMKTGKNEIFVRNWFEIDRSKFKPDALNAQEAISSNKKWFPYNKGGEFRKWYGNNDYVVNWENGGEAIFKNPKEEGRNVQDYPAELKFSSSGSWGLISTGTPSFRYKERNLSDIAGMSFFAKKQDVLYYLGFCNSKVASTFLEILAPTINYQAGDIARLPIFRDEAIYNPIIALVEENITLCRNDWDQNETSWDFKKHPLVNGTSITYAIDSWNEARLKHFSKLKKNEEQINDIFISLYRLKDVLNSSVNDNEISISLPSLSKDIRSLVSYAVGCIFGRYSLDEEGLIYAGGNWDPSKYQTIIPDSDNVIPIGTDEYFEDDLTARFIDWVRTVYGEETLEENLKFIADALGGKGTPREVIRSYFLNGFYADHLKTYHKRPIYWLFDSGKKNGFKALIYMHRYQPDTIARIRTDYVHEQQERYRSQIKHINTTIDEMPKSEQVKMRKQLKDLEGKLAEVTKYEEKIHHLADKMIKIDLDDGVKHNYALFQDVLAKIK